VALRQGQVSQSEAVVASAKATLAAATTDAAKAAAAKQLQVGGHSRGARVLQFDLFSQLRCTALRYSLPPHLHVFVAFFSFLCVLNCCSFVV
jgi:hypothetical protein